MHTEEEAVKNGCPIYYVGALIGFLTMATAELKSVKVPQDKIDSLNGAKSCTASQCAMWRWADQKWDSNRRGYCGLAGKPELTS